MDDLQKYYTKWKKSNTNEYIFYDPVYMKFPEKANFKDKED